MRSMYTVLLPVLAFALNPACKAGSANVGDPNTAGTGPTDCVEVLGGAMIQSRSRGLVCATQA